MRSPVCRRKAGRCKGIADPTQWQASHNFSGAMNAVRMYTTQVCPFCLQAKALLKQRGVAQIDEIRVDLDPAERDRMI